MLEPQRKGLAVTRSFGRPVTQWREMSEALVTYAMRAGQKLREHHIAAQYLTVFFHTSAFTDDPWYSDAVTGQFLEATNDSQEIVRLAVQLGERIWRDSFQFAKAGVLLNELVGEDQIQPSFLTGENRERQLKLWETVDEVNHKLGRGTVRVLGAGLNPAWTLRLAHRSPRWTTNWNELPKVKA
jgi:DNA polymerase V